MPGPDMAMGSTISTSNEQTELVQAVQDAEQWHGIAGAHVWSLWTRYACSAFYSHPWAWNEIGFGGPAYPRGYQALGVGKLEHWEVPERAAQAPGGASQARSRPGPGRRKGDRGGGARRDRPVH